MALSNGVPLSIPLRDGLCFAELSLLRTERCTGWSEDLYSSSEWRDGVSFSKDGQIIRVRSRRKTCRPHHCRPRSRLCYPFESMNGTRCVRVHDRISSRYASSQYALRVLDCKLFLRMKLALGDLSISLIATRAWLQRGCPETMLHIAFYAASSCSH